MESIATDRELSGCRVEEQLAILQVGKCDMNANMNGRILHQPLGIEIRGISYSGNCPFLHSPCDFRWPILETHFRLAGSGDLARMTWPIRESSPGRRVQSPVPSVIVLAEYSMGCQ